MGLDDPVRAIGVRMLLDGWKQFTGNADDYQIPGARSLAAAN